jgi:nucleoside-diphosphate-sugar epimerase
MRDDLLLQLRRDCLASVSTIPSLAQSLRDQRIAVVGGFGFAGTWLAETVAALNDELGTSIALRLIGRDQQRWQSTNPHLTRADITLQTADVRAPFEFPRDTTIVIYAAGHADSRIQASDPQRVYQSIIFGVDNALSAANRLEGISRFVNVSSGLVAGVTGKSSGIDEQSVGLLDFKRVHNLYAEARRTSEAIASAFASQYRLPVSTVRAFSFVGPHQPLDAPWAINNFIRDAITGNEVRVHGAGDSRRSYLYGSDVASWLLQAAVAGADGAVYNVGGDEPVSHAEAANLIAELVNPMPKVLMRTVTGDDGRSHDFYPNLAVSHQKLGTRVTVNLRTAIERTISWHANAQRATRLLRTA